MDERHVEVLLVEDSPGDTRLIQEYLKDQPGDAFRLTRVARLSEALAAVELSPFSVILLDLHLPDSAGIETLRRLLAVARAIPIIVMTGLDDRDLALHAVHEGAQDYLVKGQVDSEAIGRAIHHAIERQQFQVDLMQQAAALRESESMFRRVIEASADGILILDQEDTVMLANTAAAELFGKKPEDLIGVTFGMAAGRGRFIEQELAPGRFAELRSVATEWLGTPAKLVALRETSERRRRGEQQAALSSLAQLALKQPKLEVFRETAARLIAKALLCETCGIFEKRDAAAAPELVTAAGPAPADGEPWGLEAEVLGEDAPTGSVAVWTAAERAFTDDDRHFLEGAARVLAEGARRHRAEAHRQALEAQIRHAQKMESLGVLAGGIAHDFNNLLMAILGHANLAIGETPQGAPGSDHLKQIEVTAKRAADLTNQLLAYAGKGRFVIERVCLNRLVEEMGNLLHTAISRKANLSYRLAVGLPAVEGDRSQLTQVVMNLITNASESLGTEAGTITLTTGIATASERYLRTACLENELSPGPYVFLEVADTGCGMDDETRQKIFDPFYSTKFTGRGLGLASVLGVVRGHRGAICVTSQKGVGTHFRILLPPARSGRGAEVPEPGPTAAAWKGEGRVLLVDDEDMVRNVAALMLGRLGFEVRCARDGREAVAVFAAEGGTIDAIVLDMTMPDLDGKEALRAIRRMRANVPVLMTSGFTAEDVAKEVGENRLIGFLQKPFNSAMLAEKLRALLPR
jgi:signal transduction histidine kinase/DNA-binding response OmpR family regulator